MNIHSFNSFKVHLQGTLLIEASAGTGKTYTLIMLYLRLLLGIGGFNNEHSRIFSVEEILVVTFNEATTEDIRCRIIDNIQKLRIACIIGNSNNTQIAAILDHINDRNLAVLHLLAAEQQIYKAAIYTFHNFCHKMLNNFFKQTLIENEYFLCKQVSADFWRRHCYKLPINVARIVHNYWTGPFELLEEILPYLQGEPPLLRNAPDDINDSILVHHDNIINSINNLKQQWRDIASKIINIIKTSNLDTKLYSNKNLIFWLNKINCWSYHPTVDYHVPDELTNFKISVLEKNTKTEDLSKYSFFATVDAFYKKNNSLRKFILVKALKEIRSALEKEKNRSHKIGFDDIISCLDNALIGNEGKLLADLVRKRYLVAMIDDFQNTNQQQYRIFSRIYSGHIDCVLILIGDPKQALYAFKGADIFTYLRAKRKIDTYYTLESNWRSAPGIVNAVNNLFQRIPSPFIFSDIPFLPGTATDGNNILRLIIHGKPQSAIRFWLNTNSVLTEYKKSMALHCAATIRNLLYNSHKGEAWLEDHNGRKLLHAADITVLVRNSNEARLVSNALSALMIPYVYLSNSFSVFETSEARELKWILQAVLNPDKDTELRRALVTKIIGFNAEDIYALNNNEACWEQIVEDFTSYRKLWQHNNIQAMLQQIMIKYHIAENILAINGGKRRLTDLLHLSELLQEASMQLDTEYALVRWLSIKIEESINMKTENHNLRIESDQNLIKIITLHKSKGLAFPLVFLPFAAVFKIQNRPLFHDRDTYRAFLDLSASKESLRLAEEERLSEDLRMLYVALTRSIYHCSIGIAPISFSKKNKLSDLHLSAIGYLIQKKKPGNADYLNKQLATIVANSNGNITLSKVLNVPVKPIANNNAEITLPLSARKWPQLIQDPWMITSYSCLQKKNSKYVARELLPSFERNLAEDSIEKEILKLNQHTFPRGPWAGIFFHSLFEKIDFNKPLHYQWISSQLLQKGIDSIWLSFIIKWIEKIINMPLDGISLSLKKIDSDNKNVELKFYLPIDNLIQSSDIDLLCKSYDPLSALCPPLYYQQIKGMLKGFIDLVFRWKNRYYLLDYKSNWLGTGSYAYTKSMMEKSIIANRYEIQYQIYTLALHRFLRYSLKNYDFNHNFGGVYYLFLRGIDTEHPGNGIFYCRPSISLIEGLDTLFNIKSKKNK